MEKTLFGTLEDGREIYKYTVENKNGMILELITYGAAIQAIKIPSKTGELLDVTVGFDTLEGHEKYSDYQGVTVGRYANRLHNAQFTLNGKKYSVAANENDKTCLHGGGEFSKAVWSARVDTDNSVVMSYTSRSGACGFPGEMKTKVRFTLTDDNEVVINYTAICSADTPVNLTNHTYFNLKGKPGTDVLSTELRIDADSFTPIDEDSIPTGEIRSVKETAFDFSESKTIGKDIFTFDEQIEMCRGYDHNFCLNETAASVITAYEPESGITMDVYTDMPGVQLYTGNFLDGTVIGKGGAPLEIYAGFCLETQFYPDTPNQPEFPQCNIRAGEVFRSMTKYQFKY